MRTHRPAPQGRAEARKGKQQKKIMKKNTSMEVATENEGTEKASYAAGVFRWSGCVGLGMEYACVRADYFWNLEEAIGWMVERGLEQWRHARGDYYIELWKRRRGPKGAEWVLLPPENYADTWEKLRRKNEFCAKHGLTLPVPESSNKRPGHGVRTPEEMHRAFGFRLDRL